jgi:hypothetical protein
MPGLLRCTLREVWSSTAKSRGSVVAGVLREGSKLRSLQTASQRTAPDPLCVKFRKARSKNTAVPPTSVPIHRSQLPNDSMIYSMCYW